MICIIPQDPEKVNLGALFPAEIERNEMALTKLMSGSSPAITKDSIRYIILNKHFLRAYFSTDQTGGGFVGGE